jgi:hypothetical protein
MGLKFGLYMFLVVNPTLFLVSFLVSFYHKGANLIKELFYLYYKR